MATSIKGIVAGFLASMLAAVILGFAGGFLYVTIFGVDAARAAMTPTSVPILMTMLLTSVIGGYVAARVAGHSELMHGALAILAGGMFSLLGWSSAEGDVLMKILELTLLPLFGLFGGYIRLRQVATQEA